MNLKKPEFKFLISFIPLITIWFFLYHYLYKLDFIFGDNYSLLTEFSKSLSVQSNFILKIFNFQTSTEVHGDMIVSKILGYPYSHGIWIGEPCNGLKIFGLFAIFILSFKGELKKKVIFITIGIAILHLLNILRIAFLTYISATNPYILDFNHNITFQLIIYTAMLGLWYWWIFKFSNSNEANN